MIEILSKELEQIDCQELITQLKDFMLLNETMQTKKRDPNVHIDKMVANCVKMKSRIKAFLLNHFNANFVR